MPAPRYALPPPQLETVLRACADAAPKPWYPRVCAREAGVPEQALHPCLEILWLDGLVQKAEGTPETGPGLTTTPRGLEVLSDPAALQRLRDGRALVPGSRVRVVREAIRRPARPILTYAVMAVSVAVFIYGLVVAPFFGATTEDFFVGRATVGEVVVLEKLGAMLTGLDWLNGEWPRLFTSCFIHFGAVSLLAALICLHRLGRRAEQMWGQARFLILYLAAAVGGNVVGLALSPAFLLPGGWGGEYGLIGAELVWVLCNSRLLPRAAVARLRTQLALDAALVAIWFFFPLLTGSPWLNTWTDLGGFFVGAGAALVLHVQRFGPSPWRWAVLAALPPLPWLGYAFLQQEQAVNPEGGRPAATPPTGRPIRSGSRRAIPAERGRRGAGRGRRSGRASERRGPAAPAAGRVGRCIRGRRPARFHRPRKESSTADTDGRAWQPPEHAGAATLGRWRPPVGLAPAPWTPWSVLPKWTPPRPGRDATG